MWEKSVLYLLSPSSTFLELRGLSAVCPLVFYLCLFSIQRQANKTFLKSLKLQMHSDSLVAITHHQEKEDSVLHSCVPMAQPMAVSGQHC